MQHGKLIVIFTVKDTIVRQYSWMSKDVEMISEIFILIMGLVVVAMVVLVPTGAGASRTRNDIGKSCLYLQRVYWSLFS
jgi:hypothetical protein